MAACDVSCRSPKLTYTVKTDRVVAEPIEGGRDAGVELKCRREACITTCLAQWHHCSLTRYKHTCKSQPAPFLFSASPSHPRGLGDEDLAATSAPSQMLIRIWRLHLS